MAFSLVNWTTAQSRAVDLHETMKSKDFVFPQVIRRDWHGIEVCNWLHCDCCIVLFLFLQQGVIVAGGEEYLIEPLISSANQTKPERGDRAEGRPHVVYKRSSLRHQYKGQSCGVIGKNGNNSGLF